MHYPLDIQGCNWSVDESNFELDARVQRTIVMEHKSYVLLADQEVGHHSVKVMSKQSM